MVKRYPYFLIGVPCLLAGCVKITPTSPGDTTPPGAVTDLHVQSASGPDLTIAWTAPGDDGVNGGAARYDIRYSAERITHGTWDSCVPVPQLPAPGQSGILQTTQFSSPFEGDAFVAMKSADEVPNWSELSNVLLAVAPPFDPPGMVFVPSGSFEMGDGHSNCGLNQRLVTLTRSFSIGRYEVSNHEYIAALQWAYDHQYVIATADRVVDNLDGSSVFLLDLDDPNSEIVFNGHTFSLTNAGHGSSNGRNPVQQVSWYGAAAYCDWLSLRAGLPRAYDHSTWACGDGFPYGATGYRLPTDAEWEYAARYDDRRTFPWGSESPNCSLANLSACVGWTTPYGSYPGGPEIEGELLFDMAGNVWEWCNDWHICTLGTAAIDNPTGPASGRHRVLRGGSWQASSNSLACAYRWKGAIPSGEKSDIGFRCVRSE